MKPGIAFIGTRRIDDVPDEWVMLFEQAVKTAVRNENPIFTGGAPGADQLAANIALANGGDVVLCLPWPKYEQVWWEPLKAQHEDHLITCVYRPSVLAHVPWTESVHKYHPAADRLTQGAFKLHARNYGIIEHAHLVVALTHPSGTGGTEQGLRIARDLGTRTYDLRIDADRHALEAKLGVAAGA